ncbi:MAG: dephospho-CoA kinase [Desulfuromonadales bacterium]|nr:dephospho-CoA kinase [Desulfuromonadales bacterium]
MVLGLTGGIACGKSSVAGWFAELGAAILSADQLARQAVAPGSLGLQRIVALFGDAILGPDGALDRVALGRIVFADAAARRRLEAVTHPEIAHLAAQSLAELRQAGAALIVYEAPLLFEAGADKRVDCSLVVLIEPAAQLARLMQRDGLDGAAARARIAAQWPQADKVARADYVIDNSGTTAQTRLAVAALYRHLCAARQ